MTRGVFSKVMWVGRATIFALGVAVILAAVLGVASSALAANGKPFILGKRNVAKAITTLVKQNDGPALNLVVQSGQPPMKVNSSGQVTNLNADQVDGQSAGAFVKSDIYKRESALNQGTALGDGTFVKAQACDAGDVLLSGGPANVSAGSDMVESFPSPGSTNSWSARIQDNGAVDNFSVVVICANQ